MSRGLLACSLVLAVMLDGALAYACPSCAANDKGGGNLILFGMMGLPFVIVGAAYFVFKKWGLAILTSEHEDQAS